MLNPDDLIASLEKQRAILDAFRREINETIRLVALLPPVDGPQRVSCPHCGILKHPATMNDHLRDVHGLEPELPRNSGEVAGVDGLTTLGQEDAPPGLA